MAAADDASIDLRIVNEFAVSMLAQHTLPDLLWSMAAQIGRVLEFEDCVIYLVAGDVLVQSAAYGVKNPVQREIHAPIEIPIGEGIVGRAASTQQTQYVADVRNDPDYISDQFVGRSELAVPIRYAGQALGVIDAESSKLDGFSEQDRIRVQWLANVAASRIAGAIADQERRQAQHDLKLANEHLERRVARRTRELSDAVQRLESEVRYREGLETELAARKRYLDITLRSIADALIAVDLDGRIEFVSDAAPEIFGYAHEAMLGQDFAGLLGGRSPRDGRSSIIDAAGRKRTVSVASAEIRDSDGQERGRVFVIRDTSAEDSLLSEAMRTQQLESLGLLAGGIAHDFNNLLLAIEGNLSIAQEDAPEEIELQNSLGAAQAACQRARELPQLLLTLAKGGAPILTEDCSLAELVRECVDLSLIGSDLDTEIRIPAELPQLEIDRKQVALALNQLLLNARQAMPSGGTIHVSARSLPQETEQSGWFIELSIRDEGRGIPEDARSRIFEPYFTTRSEGRGLGLTIAHRIAARHGGSLDLRHAKVGAEFVLRLPCHPAAAPGVGPSVMSPAPRPARILVLDDEQPIRMMLGRMLERLGYQATLAECGNQAVELVRDAERLGRPFDLGLLDLTLPGGLGGKQVLDQLRQWGIQLPALVMSGYSSDAAVADPIGHGFLAALQKPFHLSDIRRLLSQALSGAFDQEARRRRQERSG